MRKVSLPGALAGSNPTPVPVGCRRLVQCDDIGPKLIPVQGQPTRFAVGDLTVACRTGFIANVEISLLI